jgi:hypothetical protein
MKKTKPSMPGDLGRKKLALQRTILRQLTSDDLGRVHGGTCWDRIIDPNDCHNPIYSA